MRTNKSVTKETVITDLFDGQRYRVVGIYLAKPADKEWSSMPDTVLHVWPIGAMPADELSKLRERAQYAPDDLSGPLADVAFFPVAA
jgi:hypothetical protein